MKTKRFLVSVMLVIVACMSVFAEQTPYEKKVEEICTKYYCYGTYGYNGGLDMGDMFAIAMYGPEAAAALALMNYGMKYDARQAEQWSKAMERELEAAKSLMTEEDFHKIFLKTSYGQAMTVIKEQFDTKFVKDEFETQAQFEARAKKEAAKEFDRLCGKLVANMNATLKVVISPKSYDAERGAYKIGVEESAKFSGEKGFESSYESWLPMQSNLARQYKGETINPESILSVEWVSVGDKIAVGKVKYKDDLGNIKEFTPGHQGAKPLVFDYDKYRESQPLLPGHVWAAANLKSYYELYAKKLAAIVDEYNKKITADKYYDVLSTENYQLKQKNFSLGNVDKYDEVLLQEALTKQEQEVKIAYNMKVSKMKEDCRKNNPDKFISIYANEHPDFADKVAALEADYKCYNYSYNKLAFYVIDGITPRDTKCYDKYIGLFNSSDEFYSFYSNINLFTEEVAKREVIQKKYQSVMRRLSQGETLAFKGAKDGKATDVQMFINALDEFRVVENWYKDALNAYFKADAKMMKEYEKVGSLFASKDAFFQSYVSSSYKNDLKNAKNAKK